MAKKKESESVSTGSTRVLRPRKPTTEEGTSEGKANDKAKGKKPVVVDEKAERKKSVAQGKLKIGDAGKSKVAGKRKVAHDGSAEDFGSPVKKVKNVNKNEMDKGASSSGTRVLRSQSAKRGGEALNEQAARKKAVKKDSATKAKTNKETNKRTTRASAKDESVSQKDLKGKKAVKKDSATNAKTNKDTNKRTTRASAKDESASQKDLRGKKAVKKDSAMKAKTSNETNKRISRAAAKGESASQKDVKGKKILKGKEAADETDSDDDMLLSEMQQNSPLRIGSPKAKKNLTEEPSKRIATKGAPSKKIAGDTAAGASGSKALPKQVSKSQTKRGGVQASTSNRRNPPRKARADAKTE